MHLVKFEPEHLSMFKEFAHGPSVGSRITVAELERLAARPHSYSYVEDGKVYACAGITEYWEGRGEAWIILSEGLGHRFKAIHTLTKKFLDECPIKRIEGIINVDFKDAHRWIKHLGFEVESPCMKAYGRDGADCVLYAKVKP